MIRSAKYLIDRLQLQAHPEGGYFKETYRSSAQISTPGFDKERAASTGIYFLLTQGNFSAFHRIRSDEMWHFYAGDPISIFVIDAQGQLEEIVLGLDLERGQVPQALVPADCWFASQVRDQGEYALVGCTVAPGFDFEDFELADRKSLTELFPELSSLIAKLTRE